MKKIIFLFIALSAIFTLTISINAEEVSDFQITLNLSFGERSGTYTGTLENGLPNGIGKFYRANPEGLWWHYEGEFANGQFHGEGIITWENGRTLQGTYVDSVLNGKGIYTTVNSDGEVIIRYEGWFVNGKYHGEGTLEYTDQNGIPSVYVGNFVDNVFHGEGRIYRRGQHSHEGVFENGDLHNGKVLFEGKWVNVTDGDVSYMDIFGIKDVVFFAFIGLAGISATYLTASMTNKNPKGIIVGILATLLSGTAIVLMIIFVA
jgi:hypothetical protein